MPEILFEAEYDAPSRNDAHRVMEVKITEDEAGDTYCQAGLKSPGGSTKNANPIGLDEKGCLACPKLNTGAVTRKKGRPENACDEVYHWLIQRPERIFSCPRARVEEVLRVHAEKK